MPDKLEAIIVIILMMIAVITGCGIKPLNIVYIATPCKVSLPEKPLSREDIYINIVEILKYTELLEIALKVCRDD